jgi:hypothetical protein
MDPAGLTALIRSGVISAGYNQVIPSQPTENHELKRNKHRTETTWAAVLPSYTSSYRPARMAIVAPIKIAVHKSRFRRPSRSITKMAIALTSQHKWEEHEGYERDYLRGKEVAGTIDTGDDSRHLPVQSHVVLQYRCQVIGDETVISSRRCTQLT